MNTFENSVFEPIDLCACYEPIFEPPQEVLDEWRAIRDAEIGEPAGVPTCYAVDEYGTLHFYYGNTRIKVSEHFNEKGKAIGTLIEDVIRFSAAQKMEKIMEK